MALQQFQHKSSPLNCFCPGGIAVQRKPTLFESRFCKELMGQNFDKVCKLKLISVETVNLYIFLLFINSFVSGIKFL